MSQSSFYDFEVASIAGEDYRLEKYRGKVLLVVNVASKCGLTPQYDGLEALYEKYSEQGFEVLGFPCNQFAKQEPGSGQEIQEFCRLNHGVKFPMHAKIAVNGGQTHPLYRYLKAQAPGILGTKAIKWNFTKFLVDRQGNVTERFSPNTTPDKIEPAIQALLAREA